MRSGRIPLKVSPVRGVCGVCVCERPSASPYSELILVFSESQARSSIFPFVSGVSWPAGGALLRQLFRMSER